MKPDTDLTPFTKNELKWVTDLNGKHKTRKLLADHIGVNPSNLEHGNGFLDKTQKMQSRKESTEKLDFTKV